MEINIVELIVQAGALGLTALLLFGLWKYGAAFVTRLMDNLDLQAQNHEASIKVQAEVASTLSMLCSQLDMCEADHGKRAQETVEAQAEVAKTMTTLGKRLQEHETRAQERHEQQMDQSAERHAELIGVLQGLNGK